MQKALTDKSYDFLERYVNNASPTGFEKSGQKLWLDYIKPYTDDHFQDQYDNTVALINPDARFKVVLEAHADEVSWMVNYIDNKGFIHVLPNGGADPMVAPGKHVQVHGDDGLIPGVFGWPAVHLRNDIQDLYADQFHLFIDAGFSDREDAMNSGVRVGNIITYMDHFSILNKKYFLGRALDNRVGGLIIAEVARLIREEKTELPFCLMFVNAVQEEVGLYGAKMIGERLKPDMAIVTDVTHDTNTPFIKMQRHGETVCGKGPVLAVAPAVHKGFLELIKDAARAVHIPYQLVAISRATGTDADAIALSRGGVASALISPPLRYMHTPVELVHIEDVANSIRLIVETLKRLQPTSLDKNQNIPFYTT